MTKKSLFVQGVPPTTKAKNASEYQRGLKNGRRHGINDVAYISDALWEENRIKAEGHASYDEPKSSYWRGYFDGMNEKKN